MPIRKRSSDEAEREQSLKALIADQENVPGLDENLHTRSVYTRQEKRRSGGSLMSFMPPQSPKKRSEGGMNLEETDVQSPSAKRRSLHSPGLDFSIFESESLHSMENRTMDDNDWLRTGSPAHSSRFSTIPKRSSSLRRSTVQQRQNERPSQLKLTHIADFDGFSFDATPAPKNGKGLRMSLDNYLEPMPRESPFAAQGSLLSASVHPATAQHGQQQDNSQQQGRHPLSRTMTQSSSTSSFQDDSPTHEPAHRPARPQSHEFAKSMPLGATRYSQSEESEQSSQGSFATPGNYKFAKPLPAAFMSTGLISKKNRNAEAPDGGFPKAHMPDTPCKKQSLMFPEEGKFKAPKAAASRSTRVSFGTPATPYEASHSFSKPSMLPFAKSVGLFGARPSRPSMMRKASFASIESEDKPSSQSPTNRGDSQSTESDFPPTPSKHLEAQNRASISPSPHRSRMPMVPHFNSSSNQGSLFASSKLSPVQASPESVEGDSDSVMEDSPSAKLRPKSVRRLATTPGASFTQGRVLRNMNSPAPLSRKALASSLRSPISERAKHIVSPVTPRVVEGLDPNLPHTPLESCFPPDPSNLSISGHGERPTTRSGPSPAIPETPTGPREYFPNFSNRPSLNLSSANAANADACLVSRFDKVDLVGTGEFSQVYRVSSPPQTSPFHKIYSVSSTGSASSSPLQRRVFAVKKSRYPYAGARDRQRKIHEVDVLKALGQSDHVVSFVDSWEHDAHLYIQTEFCEEGTLDVFLYQMGLKARLDDFRIWKILLELSQVSLDQSSGEFVLTFDKGLKHIHDSGFIHLDLKPANVLVTFEGVLKIADFGMASKWPAKSGIEGEGDREYIGPEILRGQFDKPADLFALGLIMLETAGNVELPDNGESWQKLRNGDMSDVPSLTWSSEDSSVFRDATGNPVSPEKEQFDDVEIIETDQDDEQSKQNRRKSLQLARSGELTQPPTFMTDPTNASSLDQLVRWMIAPNPAARPLAQDVLDARGVMFVDSRRRAGATVYEGNFGPADEVLAEDAEMLDV